MNTSSHTQVRATRTAVGLWLDSQRSFIRFTGKDAASWLQSQTTNDVAALTSGQGHANALLDRQGRLQAHFTLHRWEDEYWMLLDEVEKSLLLEQLDAHLFIEEVEIDDASEQVDHVIIQGPKILQLLADVLDTEEEVSSELLPSAAYGCHPIQIFEADALAFSVSFTGEDGYVLVVERGQGDALLESLLQRGRDIGALHVEEDARNILRIEAGIPRFGVDVDRRRPLPETTLEREAVSYDKGCYLGQEVVARLKAYGSVKTALMGVEFDQEFEASPALGVPILLDGKKIGQVQSHCLSPTLDRTIALAYLDRDHRVPDSLLSVTIDDQPYEVRVVVLPFINPPSRTDRASALYENALALFEKDLNDEDESAIPLLREAILLNPSFEDAYEALGVILNRHHRIDEAIHYMKCLVRLNPNCMMAHSNLSVFYVAKGMIEEAEEEKAKAAVLGIQHASDERKAKEIATAERERIQQEAEERIGMFKEVLEIDPLDPVATFGLGKAYIQLQKFDDAIPHLEKAIEAQSDYSAAYLEMGKCHEFMERAEAASDCYREGIAVASRKGDLMPMREMERRIKALQPAPAQQ